MKIFILSTPLRIGAIRMGVHVWKILSLPTYCAFLYIGEKHTNKSWWSIIYFFHDVIYSGIVQYRISANFPMTIWRIFHYFGSTGPIFKNFTFLETASKFISTFESDLRVHHEKWSHYSQSNLFLQSFVGVSRPLTVRLIKLVHVFFSDLQECLYPIQRDEVLQNPCQSPSTRRISTSEALAEDMEIFLVRGLRQGFCNTSSLWTG